MKKVFFRIAYKNIRRHWKKSLITSACLALGFAGIVLLGGYMIRMEKYLTTQGIYLNHVGHISVYKKGGLERHLIEPQVYSFNPSEQDTVFGSLKGKTEIEQIARFFHGQGLITNDCQTFPFLAWASEPVMESYLRSHPLVQERIPLLTKIPRGHGFWEGEQYSNGIVVTGRLAQLLDKPLTLNAPKEDLDAQAALIEDCKNPASEITIRSHSGVQLLGYMLEGGLGMADTNIVGHYSTGFALSEDSSLIMPLSLAQSFYGTDNVTSLGIFFRDSSSTSSFMRWLKEEAKKWPFEAEFFDYQDYRVNPFYVGAMRFVYIMNLFFFIIVCGVVVLSLFNSIQIAILERKTEIGTLLSVGYRKSQIRNLFEAESVLLAALGLMSGLVLAIISAIVINALGFEFDIVGNSERLILVLEINWILCSILIGFFFLLAYASTSFICRMYLNVPVMQLLDRGEG